jgi:hypothetical protein
MRTLALLLAVTTAWLVLIGRPTRAADSPEALATAVRREATLPNAGPEGRPLPLAASWCTGGHPRSQGWRPAEQLRLLAEGHFVLPWLSHPPHTGTLEGDGGTGFREYYEGPTREAARLGLPLCFVASQYERLLSEKPYLDLPPEQNPNVVTVDGTVRREVCPFGPVEPWREVGRMMTDNAAMRALQEWYPEPPLVLFLSNNEHGKLRWLEVEQSARYLDRFGTGRDDDFRRRVVGDGWIERYRALQGAMRSGLASPAWRKAARFIAYAADPSECLGRWPGWVNYSLHCRGRFMPYPLMWDGCSPSFYTHDWCPTTDHTTWSPQVEFMNTLFALRDGYAQNPEWWYELSLWDGNEWPWPKQTPSKPATYVASGQVWSPERYEGFVQFGLWLLQPRLLREYRGWTTPWADAEPYFRAVLRAVDRVHTKPVLAGWWRHSALVPNRSRAHPYQAEIPEEYRGEDRWFLLDCDRNPQEYPWDLHWKIPVFALARVRGTAPQRQWLIYAHAPLGAVQGAVLTLPELGPVTADIPLAGGFLEVDEATRAAKPVP